MRQLPVFPLLALAILTLVPASAQAADRKNCNPAGSRTVDASRSVRVFRLRHYVYACAYRTDRPVRVGDAYIPCSSSSDCGGPKVAGIAGRWVALRYVQGGATSTPTARLVVVDAVSRRSQSAYSSFGAPDAPKHDFAGVSAARITATGRFALVADFLLRDGTWVGRQVRVGNGSRPGSTLVDDGVGIDPFSLAVAHSTAYWKHSGQVRTAEMPN